MPVSRPSTARPRAPSVLAFAVGLALACPSMAQERPGEPAASPSADPATTQADPPRKPARVGLGATGATSTADAARPPAAGAEPATGSRATAPAEPQGAAAGVDTPTAGAVPPVPAEPPITDAAAAPTAAEEDFDALYGEAAGEASVARPAAHDPWERYNRRMHRFNNAVDRRVARPLAQAYVRAVPTPVRAGVSNFFSNLGQPVSAVNALLQGKPRQAAHSVGRFVLNSTLGIGGVFDPASAARLENRSEDFGQTLGVWGWRRSRYVELPLFGPRTLRDVLGMAGDAPLSPLRQVDADRIRVPLQGMQLVDLRSQLLSTDALREGVEDDYILVRDAWSQRRDYQIMGDREAGDEEPTVVPVDAMPVTIDN